MMLSCCTVLDCWNGNSALTQDKLLYPTQFAGVGIQLFAKASQMWVANIFRGLHGTGIYFEQFSVQNNDYYFFLTNDH